MSHLRSGCIAAVLAVAVGAAMAAPASAASDHRTVKILDDCDPATFNAVIGPGTCIGDGRTTFFEFIAEFQATGAVDGWEFKPDDFKIRAGGTITADNRGGEFHTFTPVDQFTSGCIPELQRPDFVPPTEEQCSEATFIATGVLPGQEREFEGFVDEPGVQRFQCLIHPWMISTAEVEGDKKGRKGKGKKKHDRD